MIYNRRMRTSLYANTYILYHYWDENTDHSIITPAPPSGSYIIYINQIKLRPPHSGRPTHAHSQYTTSNSFSREQSPCTKYHAFGRLLRAHVGHQHGSRFYDGLWCSTHTKKSPTQNPVGLACCGFPATTIKSYSYQGAIIISAKLWRRVLLAKIGCIITEQYSGCRQFGGNVHFTCRRSRIQFPLASMQARRKNFLVLLLITLLHKYISIYIIYHTHWSSPARSPIQSEVYSGSSQGSSNEIYGKGS